MIFRTIWFWKKLRKINWKLYLWYAFPWNKNLLSSEIWSILEKTLKKNLKLQKNDYTLIPWAKISAFFKQKGKIIGVIKRIDLISVHLLCARNWVRSWECNTHRRGTLVKNFLKWFGFTHLAPCLELTLTSNFFIFCTLNNTIKWL